MKIFKMVSILNCQSLTFVTFHLTAFIVGFRVKVQNFAKIWDYVLYWVMGQKTTSYNRPSAILNLKVLRFGQRISVMVLIAYKSSQNLTLFHWNIAIQRFQDGGWLDRHLGFPNFEKFHIRQSLLSDLSSSYKISRKSDNPKNDVFNMAVFRHLELKKFEF